VVFKQGEPNKGGTFLSTRHIYCLYNPIRAKFLLAASASVLEVIDANCIDYCNSCWEELNCLNASLNFCYIASDFCPAPRFVIVDFQNISHNF